MEMEFMPEFTQGMSRRILKRKRTKRHRPSSPFADGYCLIDNSTPEISTSTEEDQDMANCLIMLAQSVSPTNQICRKTDTSGFCAYECKTCNRTFPSFQALGGHRASHKKPKASVEEKKTNSPEYSDEDPDQHKSAAEDEENKTNSIGSNNLQTGISSSSKGKVHECSICGSEFTSGQALGGHMRKHRPIPPSVNRLGATINTTADQIIERSPGGISSNMFSLDLNFPPPEAMDDVESKFKFTSSSSQQHLVISATTLVDCRY